MSEGILMDYGDLARRLKALEDSEARVRAHRMKVGSPRTDEEKKARVTARKVRKRQKLARRRNRR